MTATEVLDDLEDIAGDDRELMALHNQLLKKYASKGREFVQLARSHLTGEVRYIVKFRPGDGVNIHDITTGEIYSLAA